jgi:tetratricopeptide (TPR) repeat protein
MAHLTWALELAHKYNLKMHLVHILTSLADLQIRQRDWDAADITLKDVEHLALEMNAKTELPEIYCDWAQVNLARGNLQTALDWAEKSLQLAHELKLGVAEGKALRMLGQVLAVHGQRQQAIETFERSLTVLANDPYEAARTKMYWGLALISSTEKERGISLLQDARITFERLGASRDLEIVEEYLNEGD